MKKITYKITGSIAILSVYIVVITDLLGEEYAQDYLQKLLKTPVSIGKFDSHIFDKSIDINFIEVQNPPNFKGKNALSLDHFLLKIGDISGDLIVIDEITIDGLEFVLEQNAHNFNLVQLIDNLDTSGDSNTNTQSNKRIKIKRLKVINIRLEINTIWLKTSISVPDISAQNFGGNTGAKIDDIGKQVIREILFRIKKYII